jgi:hypothetical protein
MLPGRNRRQNILQADSGLRRVRLADSSGLIAVSTGSFLLLGWDADNGLIFDWAV